MTDHREMEHRDACHDGRWDASCAECHGYEVRGQTRLLEAIHDEQQAQTGLLADLRGAGATIRIDDLACRHCPEGPKSSQKPAQEALGDDSGTQGHQGGSRAHSGDSGIRPESDTVTVARVPIGHYPSQWSPKGLQEHLCNQQTFSPDERTRWTIQILIDLLVSHRPVGPDGKHGERHTGTCGCAL